MYVLLDDQENVLIDEIDYVTGEHHHLFVAPERIDAINSYHNKEAKRVSGFEIYNIVYLYIKMRFKKTAVTHITAVFFLSIMFIYIGRYVLTTGVAFPSCPN